MPWAQGSTQCGLSKGLAEQALEAAEVVVAVTGCLLL